MNEQIKILFIYSTRNLFVRKKENIETIYTAALKIFAKFGYQKATVEDIAKTMNMTKGNLYLYVKNKKALYRETVSWALQKWQFRVATAVDRETDVKRRFEVMCFKAVEYLSQDDHLRRVLIHDPEIFPMFPEKDPFEEINQNSVLMIKTILEQGIEEKAFRKVNTERVSEIIFLIYKMFIIRTYIKRETEFMQQVFAETVELVTHGLFMESPLMGVEKTGT
ncbi:MAG: TetR/AcrR family transcriptional regulator [Desulfobacteraceae bacterium]|nr:MAG: TetR/AcrR family transcriptional regulator [Desulfobacteraceae bacterium]